MNRQSDLFVVIIIPLVVKKKKILISVTMVCCQNLNVLFLNIKHNNPPKWLFNHKHKKAVRLYFKNLNILMDWKWLGKTSNSTK